MRPSQIPNCPSRPLLPRKQPLEHRYHSPHKSNGSVWSKYGENCHHHFMSFEALHRRSTSPPHRQIPNGCNYQDSTGHNKREQREKAPEGPGGKDHSGHHANKSKAADSSRVMEQDKPPEQPLLSGSMRGPDPLQRKGSWNPSSSIKPAPIKDKCRRASFPPADLSTSTLNQPHQQIQPNEASHTKDSHNLQKRRRESASDNNSKRRCLQPTGPDGTLSRPTLNDLSPQSSSQKLLCGLELPPKALDNHTAHPHTTNPSNPSSYLKRAPMGAKQACIKSMQNNIVTLLSPSKGMEDLTKADEESKQKGYSRPSQTYKRALVSDPNMPNDTKSSSRVNQADNKAVDSVGQKGTVKQNINPTRCRKLHRNKKTVVSDDIQDLFTPDPTVYIVNSGHRTPKVKPDDKTKNTLMSAISSNPQKTDPKTCLHEKTATNSSQASNATITNDVKISLPSVILTRLQLPTANATTESLDEQESVRIPRKTSVSQSKADGQSKENGHEDSLDLDLDLDMDLELEMESIPSSDSEDEQLVSLHEIMTKKHKPKKDMSEREAFSESRTAAQKQHNRPRTVSTTKTLNYKNSLDQILKELNTSKKAKETETELLTACQEDLLRIAEYEEAESSEEPISAEQQQFLQRFSLTSSAIRDVPPGHELFNLEKFGRIFNQNTLQLRQCTVVPENTAQKTLLWSSHAHFKSYIHYGLFQVAYNNSPCPFQITRFLFKMMSVHSDRLLSSEILQILTDIAYTAAVQRVEGGNEKFMVWVPSLADITLALMNMGAPFVSLFPLESLQPPFTEGDLLDRVYIKTENSSNQEPKTFPEHNCTCIYKYLKYCLDLCPRFYSDSELLLLLTLLCTVSLESRLLLCTSVDVYPVLYKLLLNIRRWDDMMPKMCQALTDLTDDHHNMCHLAKLLPHHSRGMNLRQHLSLSMISKLLDGRRLYTPKSKEIQLCDLRVYLPRMRASCLLRTITGHSHQSHAPVDDDNTSLDQQAYYLCYSLLTLTNEATNFSHFPAHQKEQLLVLCSALERHVKCHIREGEKWLYRSKVKDLVARVYTKWQMMLQKTRPLNGKLYDYWQPPQGDTGSSQDIEEIESSQEATQQDCTDDKEEAGVKMEDGEEEEEVTEMEVTQKENEENDIFKETIMSSAAEETRTSMDFRDEALDQLATKYTAEDTFELDSEGGTNTTQDV